MADTPSMYWKLNELGQLPIADSSGLNRTGTYRDGLSYGAAGALTDTTTAVQSPGISGVGYSNQQVTNPQVYSLEAFVKTSSNGGKILGLENAQTGFGTTYDRHLYLTGGRRCLRHPRRRRAAGDHVGQHHQRRPLPPHRGDPGRRRHGPLRRRRARRHEPDRRTRRRERLLAPRWRQPHRLAEHAGRSALVGTYDEVAVYPTALSADRVLAHYTAASTDGTPPPRHRPTSTPPR